MSHFFRRVLSFGSAAFIVLATLANGLIAGEAEVLVLSQENWDDAVTSGKEVDANYGDYVLRNDQIVCIVGKAVSTRNANMTVRGVGGAIIDLSNRKFGNDQLSAFYPLAGKFKFGEQGLRVMADQQRQDSLQAAGKNVSLILRSVSGPKGLSAEVRYSISAASMYVSVTTKVKNETEKEIGFPLADGLRADRTFSFASDSPASLFVAQDEWFRQCYGVFAPKHRVQHKGGRLVTISYEAKDGSKSIIAPNGELTWSRRIFPAGNSLRAAGIAARMNGAEIKTTKLEIVDPNGPVGSARVTVKAGGKTIGRVRTAKQGIVQFPTTAEELSVEVEAVGRPTVSKTIAGGDEIKIALAACGYLQGKLTGEDGKGIPCKIGIFAQPDGGGQEPDYGPDSGAWGVKNLRYAANGRFKCELAPGKYDIVVSRGPEYDAYFTAVEIKQNETTAIESVLKRVVDTQGWVSADYHSHSSPSGDNTGSQLGRVQNLLAEHIEFAPCTEHNRISSYTPHLDRLKAHRWMATCTGMELTGQPLPINHQNAFPLVMKPRTQDNGGPVTDGNPVAQIERLAMWDRGAEKLVQGNHPNLVQILGDRDLNGEYDGGFQGMLKFMDVVEVHPPIGIFNPPEAGPLNKLPRNPMFHWLQMLNLGYRITGVVNTDAHYNFHGSGWIRNYVKSSTDAPAEIDTMEMVRASEKGRVIMTTGPYLEVTASSGDKSAGPGDNISADGPLKIRVKIQCSNWLDVNRVQVFINGRPSAKHNFTRRTHPRMFKDGVIKFDEIIEAALEKDAHIIVATVGEGLTLGRVAGPRFGNQAPVAVANPIFVDVDGDGFKANGDLLDLPIPVK